MDALRAQMLDELGYDPDDGRPQLAEVEVAPGAVVAARDGAREVAVARLASGRLVVVDDTCPHDGGRISDGYVDGELVVCARHGWAWSADGDQLCRARCRRQ